MLIAEQELNTFTVSVDTFATGAVFATLPPVTHSNSHLEIIVTRGVEHIESDGTTYTNVLDPVYFNTEHYYFSRTGGDSLPVLGWSTQGAYVNCHFGGTGFTDSGGMGASVCYASFNSLNKSYINQNTYFTFVYTSDIQMSIDDRIVPTTVGNDIIDTVKTNRQEAYDRGEALGYQSGYQSGKNDGYNLGISETVSNPLEFATNGINAIFNTEIGGSGLTIGVLGMVAIALTALGFLIKFLRG